MPGQYRKSSETIEKVADRLREHGGRSKNEAIREAEASVRRTEKVLEERDRNRGR